ncbi:BTB/POZ domain and ankyrin repeat-containing protein NPR1 [Amborella trichopoda]|uniref:Uncharacterized protein n=1 Tax=Amborella trichopoda TaxID=13333 RepID=U5CQ74_AMBTC|nr:BTB/POZ domain and ankyrin repeat-containing protein NPR1 [Amborella trichopoda]ERN15331.1 hypothetical protein AMTR_s00036p00114630 [Amborella trichopoda]|eukprot:XP_006853864.1 BTB/POZ domain and ankyrin repeat-containing protein NPR1 [Amborella trichopoda]
MASHSSPSQDGGGSCISNGETTVFSDYLQQTTPDLVALTKLSECLDSLFHSSDLGFCADARIIAGKREIPVHRCVLACRSPFLQKAFAENSGKERFEIGELAKDFEVGPDALMVVLGYIYSGKVGVLPQGVCVCADEECSHHGCRPAVDFAVEVLYASFIFQINELVSLFQRHLLEILDKVAIDDILVILSVATICDKASERLLLKCKEIVVNSDLDITSFEKALPIAVVKEITDLRSALGLVGPGGGDGFPDKHVKRIHRALDSDDVELVRMLLKEEHSNLDDAYALHYAVAYCDSKTTIDLLDLGLADVNHRNQRGYTVLHIAAMRREPKIIVSLLTKGARPSDLTSDGRKALHISKRLTKFIDFSRSTEEAEPTPKERLCIEILEQAERRDPLPGEASVSLAIAGDDLRRSLIYLETRVGLAKFLYPMEAQVAMEIAQVEGTLELPLAAISKFTSREQMMTAVDLNDSPFKIKDEYLSRMKALSRTVELGKRFFPRCSAELNKIMNDADVWELAFLGKGTSEEQTKKRKRYVEVQEMLRMAFNKDKEENKSAMSSCSSSLSIDGGMVFNIAKL